MAAEAQAWFVTVATKQDLAANQAGGTPGVNS